MRILLSLYAVARHKRPSKHHLFGWISMVVHSGRALTAVMRAFHLKLHSSSNAGWRRDVPDLQQANRRSVHEDSRDFATCGTVQQYAQFCSTPVPAAHNIHLISHALDTPVRGGFPAAFEQCVFVMNRSRPASACDGVQCRANTAHMKLYKGGART
jgi:hypothetical protein